MFTAKKETRKENNKYVVSLGFSNKINKYIVIVINNFIGNTFE
jgi:hypothetical protein